MSQNEGFILKAEQYNQEEWCEMFRRISETCKDLRTENECLQNQLQQKENIIKEAKDFINGKNLKENEYRFAEDFDFAKLLEILGDDKS